MHVVQERENLEDEKLQSKNITRVISRILFDVGCQLSPEIGQSLENRKLGYLLRSHKQVIVKRKIISTEIWQKPVAYPTPSIFSCILSLKT